MTLTFTLRLTCPVCRCESRGAMVSDVRVNKRSLRDQCQAANVAFLFKQWGGRTPKAGGRQLDGRIWDDYPVEARR